MLKVGLIGCGTISNIHIPIVMEHTDSELVALCDTDPEKVMGLSSEIGCNGYVDYVEMIRNERLDIVHICTPHHLHKEMILQAIRAGIHVLCEKPVVMNLDEAEEVIKASKDAGVKVGVVLQNRHNTTSLKIKEYIDGCHLGKATGIKAFLTWYRPEDYYLESDWRGSYLGEGGGLLINQSIHTLDLLQWFMGQAKWVQGSHSIRALQGVIEVEDTAEAHIAFQNGAKGIFYGTNGYVENSPLYMDITFEKGSLKLVDNMLISDTEGEKSILAQDEDNESVKNYYGVSHELLIDTFYKAVIDGTDNYVDLKQGTEVLKLIEGIRQSHRSGEKYYY